MLLTPPLLTVDPAKTPRMAQEASQAWMDLGHAHVKTAGLATTSYSLRGMVYVSKSGWLLLNVPNSLIRGCFDALHEPGAELPPSKGKILNGHVSVMSKEEIEQIGGPSRIVERGHFYSYSLGGLKTVDNPTGWGEMSRVWFLEVKSPELQKLRASYGLSPLPRHPFHATVAVRRKNILRDNDMRKGASYAEGDPGWGAAREGGNAGVQQLAGDDRAMRVAEAHPVQGLRSQRDHGLPKMAAELLGLPGGYGPEAAQDVLGTSRQLPRLLARQLLLGVEDGPGTQQAKQSSADLPGRDLDAGRVVRADGLELRDHPDQDRQGGLGGREGVDDSRRRGQEKHALADPRGQDPVHNGLGEGTAYQPGSDQGQAGPGDVRGGVADDSVQSGQAVPDTGQRNDVDDGLGKEARLADVHHPESTSRRLVGREGVDHPRTPSLLKRAFEKIGASALRKRLQLQFFPKEDMEGRGIFTATLGGRRVGSLEVDRLQSDMVPRVRLSAVDPKMRGLGVGKWLYGQAMRRMPEGRLNSDLPVSPAAIRVWKSMTKRPSSYQVGVSHVGREISPDFPAGSPLPGQGVQSFAGQINSKAVLPPVKTAADEHTHSDRLPDGSLRTLDVLKLYEILKGRQATQVPLADLQASKQINRSSNTGFSKKRYAQADTSYPVMLDQGRLIDGRHRLAKLLDQGASHAMAHQLTPEDVAAATIKTAASRIPKAIQAIVDECKELEEEDTAGGIYVMYNPGPPARAHLDVMDWGDDKLGNRIQSVLEQEVGKENVERVNEGGKPEGPGWVRVEAACEKNAAGPPFKPGEWGGPKPDNPYETDPCPKCGEFASHSVRCINGGWGCPNGHSWHKCWVHKDKVVDGWGGPRHCTCGSEKQADSPYNAFQANVPGTVQRIVDRRSDGELNGLTIKFNPSPSPGRVAINVEPGGNGGVAYSMASEFRSVLGSDNVEVEHGGFIPKFRGSNWVNLHPGRLGKSSGAMPRLLKLAAPRWVKKMRGGELSAQGAKQIAEGMQPGQFRTVNHLGSGDVNIADRVVGNVGGQAGQMVRKIPRILTSENLASHYRPVIESASRLERMAPGQQAPIHGATEKGLFQALATPPAGQPAGSEAWKLQRSDALTKALKPFGFWDIKPANLGPGGQVIDFADAKAKHISANPGGSPEYVDGLKVLPGPYRKILAAVNDARGNLRVSNDVYEALRGKLPGIDRDAVRRRTAMLGKEHGPSFTPGVQEGAAPANPKEQSARTYIQKALQSRLAGAPLTADAQLGTLPPGTLKVAANHHAPPVETQRRDGKKEHVCPHCGKPMTPDEIYTDAKGWHFHRPCFRKGKGSIKLGHYLVTGHSGAGKSTVAQRLAEKLGLPVDRLDDAPGFKDFLKANPGVGHMDPQDPSHAEYTAMRRRLVEQALSQPDPRVIEGHQLAPFPELWKGHQGLLVDAPVSRIVRQRLARDRVKHVAKGKVTPEETRPGSPWSRERRRVARQMFDLSDYEIQPLREDPSVLKLPGGKAPLPELPKMAEAMTVSREGVSVPHKPQETDHTCGPAALRSVIGAFKDRTPSERTLADSADADPEGGTPPDRLLATAGKHGLKGHAQEEMTLTHLRQLTEAGKPVLVCMQAHGGPGDHQGWQAGHYVVVTKVDDQHVHYKDPASTGSDSQMKHDDFLAHWHDQDSGGKKYRRLGIAMWGDGEKNAHDAYLDRCMQPPDPAQFVLPDATEVRDV